MGKKKRNHPDVEEILSRPWCYYCERDFDDLKILISHQKAKHFKCDRCGRRLNTAGGLSVHMNQVHKETLNSVENALPNRSNLDVEIFGMEGIPEDTIQAHNQRVVQQFYEAEANRRAATGNPGPAGSTGGAGGGVAKKPKLENPSDLKKRLAEHKAKKAAEAAGGSNGDVNGSPANHGSPNPVMNQGQPPYDAFHAPQPGPAPPQFQQPYGQPPFPQSQPPPFQQPHGYPPPQGPFSPPNAGPFAPPPAGHFGHPGGPPFQPQHVFPGGPPPPFAQGPPQHGFPGPPQPMGYPLVGHNGMPQRPLHGPPFHGAPQNLPANPSPVNAPHFSHLPQGRPSHLPPLPVASLPPTSQAEKQRTASAVDELISSAAKEADEAAAAAAAAASSPAKIEIAPPEKESKKSKKDKGKERVATRLVYSDDKVSPEEKMASLSRYAFNRPSAAAA